MLIHTVLLSLVSESELTPVLEAMTILESLVDQLDGMQAFHHGPTRDFEGTSAAYHYGFVVEFADRDAHLAYARHPEHVRAGAMLVAACAGGHDGIFVSDLDTSPEKKS